MNSYLRGSEWRRWELHTHTPASYLNNGYGSDWDKFVKELFSKALRYDIAAIGLTDYFTIDGYKKVKTEYLENEAKLHELFTIEEIERIRRILIVPNIEFRLDLLVNGNRVNFHVIFSDKVPISDIEDNFLHELNFVSEANPQSEDEKWKLKFSNLEALGKKLKAEHGKFASESDICVGMKCAVVSDKEIVDILANKKSKFKGRYLVFVPCDEDLSKISWDGQGHLVRKLLIQKSDGLMTSNCNTRKWGLGKFGEDPQDYIKEFKSLKPCVWGADAHCYETMFSPAENNFCWIKAIPSFDGLKQIVYEPEDRVKIQEIIPEQKNSYQLINEVRFTDKQFSPDPILISQNLTTIIGGKSTGKSLLLRNIAKTIDPEEVAKRLNDVELPDYPTQINNFTVVWNDGQSQSLSANQNIPKKIIYIPQSYFNRLVDNEESRTSIDDILTGVLEQIDEIKTCFLNLESKNREIKINVSETIENVFFTLEDWKRQHLKIREIGDKIGIRQAIEHLTATIESLKTSSGMSEDEILKYNQSVENIKNINKQNEVLLADVEILKKLNEFPQIQIEADKLSDELRIKMERTFADILQKFRNEWSNFVDDQVLVSKELAEKNYQLLNVETAIIKPYVDKINNTNTLKSYTEKCEAEVAKLKSIDVEEEVLNDYAKKYRKEIQILSNLADQYYANLTQVQDTVLKLGKVNSDIELSLSVDFKAKLFQKKFVEEVCNLRSVSKFEDLKLLDFGWESSESFRDDISKVIVGIFDGKIVLKNNYTKKEAITKLLQDWFIINYHITYKGDELSQMSPGKKSFVLLKLLLDLDNSTCPLLIDQPEDDLDNRSIYDELVTYIKRSKKKRQIIVATHNPNLVVSADAEEVIVANQHGEESLNEKYQFEYVSNALEHTYLDPTKECTLKRQGIREHVCDILEGGELAFQKRSAKYDI